MEWENLSRSLWLKCQVCIAGGLVGSRAATGLSLGREVGARAPRAWDAVDGTANFILKVMGSHAGINGKLGDQMFREGLCSSSMEGRVEGDRQSREVCTGTQGRHNGSLSKWIFLVLYQIEVDFNPSSF